MTALVGMNLSPMAMGVVQATEAMSRIAASSVISGLWEGVVLAAGAALCLRMVPRTTAAMRFAVWTAVFAMLALLPLLHAYVGGTAAGHGAAMHVDVRWSVALAGLWLAISLVRGVKLVVGAVRVQRLWKTAVPVELATRQALGFSTADLRGAQLCTSAEIDRPSVIGFFSPRILIPEEMLGRLTTTELEQVVLHEVGHLRRADDWINLLQKLGLVLIPLNPALMWIERRLCLEREMACDDGVLLLTKAPKAYATCLTNLAEHRLGKRATSLSLGAWEKQSELARRVHCILRRSEGMSRMQARVVLSAMAVVLLGGATELSRCPQLVSFSGGGTAVAAETSSLPAGAYEPVVFHPASHTMMGAAGTPHETLLNASMPVDRGSDRLSDHGSKATRVPAGVPARSRRSATAPATVRLKQARHVVQPARHWVVLTSWNSGEGLQQHKLMFDLPGDSLVSASYAAIPTQDGWLVLQL
jgi:beta-lactamase regulating signal transducer with metallopeptidase domain